MLKLDHLVIATTNLARGSAELEAMLGLSLAPGGSHGAMGTHNRLLSLGPDAYLELIAIDPDAGRPDQPRWYALDDFEGATRLTHWAARVPDLDAALALAPEGASTPWDLSRGELRWRMAVPKSGQTPFDGLYPALLQWQTPHPAPRLPDHGFRLSQMTLHSPDADALREALPPVASEAEVRIVEAAAPQLSATLVGPTGEIAL